MDILGWIIAIVILLAFVFLFAGRKKQFIETIDEINSKKPKRDANGRFVKKDKQ